MTGCVEGGDHDVFARDRCEVEWASGLIDESEGRHGDELARELTETEVHIVVAGVDRTGHEPARVDAQQERLQAPRADADCDARCVVAESNVVVGADRQSARDELGLARRRRYAAGHGSDRHPRSIRLAKHERRCGQSRGGAACGDDDERARRGLQARRDPQDDDGDDGRQCGRDPENPTSRQGITWMGGPPYFAVIRSM